jgi:hypothetical protein
MRVRSWFTLWRWSTDAYGVTLHFSRFADAAKNADYSFTHAALEQKWEALGAHGAVHLAFAALLLALRGRK